VECRNLADGCAWTGELRDAIDHEEKCGKNEKLVWERFEVELKNMSSCMMNDLMLQVKHHEQRLEDKDKQIEKQNKLIEHYSKHLEDQTKLIEKQSVQIENCNKQIEVQNILMEK